MQALNSSVRLIARCSASRSSATKHNTWVQLSCKNCRCVERTSISCWSEPHRSITQTLQFGCDSLRPVHFTPIWGFPWQRLLIRQFAGFAGQDRDHYEVLGVPPGASQAEIKRAYLQEAKKCHPDLNPSPDATKRFQQLAQAYQVLGDPDQRQTYDSVRAQGGSGPGSGARRTSSTSAQTGPHPDPVDPYKLFRAVLEEMGAEGMMTYLQQVQREAKEAAQGVQSGNLKPAKDFAWKNKGLVGALVLPVVAIVRFPGVIGFALRLIGIVTGVLLSNPQMSRFLGRLAWYQFSLLLSRAKVRARSKGK